MKKVANNHLGGKVVVFCGDFRQILLVIPKATKQQIIFSTINSSYIWDSFKVLRLSQNMRLQKCQSSANTNEIKAFTNWIIDICKGKLDTKNNDESIIKFQMICWYQFLMILFHQQ